MASIVFPYGAIADKYRGLPSIYEFINSDGAIRQFNCGHAAACTMLTLSGALPPEPSDDAARLTMRAIEAQHPPDNMGGWFGTSRRRAERILRAHDIPFRVIKGEAELRESLSNGHPVMVMLGTEGKRFWKWHAPTGHWIVVYGFDDKQVFCSNWNEPGISWEEFRYRWSKPLTRVISMHNTGLAAIGKPTRSS